MTNLYSYRELVQEQTRLCEEREVFEGDHIPFEDQAQEIDNLISDLERDYPDPEVRETLTLVRDSVLPEVLRGSTTVFRGSDNVLACVDWEKLARLETASQVPYTYDGDLFWAAHIIINTKETA